jgi:hypothetical protein
MKGRSYYSNLGDKVDYCIYYIIQARFLYQFGFFPCHKFKGEDSLNPDKDLQKEVEKGLSYLYNSLIINLLSCWIDILRCVSHFILISL